MSAKWLGPECRAGKHESCDGSALDLVADEIVPCACKCHPKDRNQGDLW